MECASELNFMEYRWILPWVYVVGARLCWMRPTPLAKRLRMSWKDTLDFGVCGHARALPLGGLGLLQNNVAHDYQNLLEEV